MSIPDISSIISIIDSDIEIHDAYLNFSQKTSIADFQKTHGTSGSTRVETYSIEPYLPGEYIKYNDNFGHTANEDEVALAFFQVNGQSLFAG